MNLASNPGEAPLEAGARAPIGPLDPPVAYGAGAMPSASPTWAGRILLGVLVVAAMLALVLVLMLWQKVSGMQEQLARQSADAIAHSSEARTLARQASDTVRDAAARVALLESRVQELALQRAQLDDLVATLSRSRDESLVVDIDAAVRLGLQQAQITGNVEPLLTALKAGEQRVSRAAHPRLAPLQRALTQDIERIRSSAGGSTAESLRAIDDLIRLVDDLPPINAVAPQREAQLPLEESLPADAPWWERWLATVRQEARSLLRVGRVDRPEAVLVAPDQVFFLRENLKLRLLSARLALLSRQASTVRGELAAVSVALNRYFDPASRRTQTAATLLQQVQAQARDGSAPQIDATLAALSAAAAVR